MVLACQQCRYNDSGTITVEILAVRFECPIFGRNLGTVLGTDWLKKPRKNPKGLQTAAARRCRFCLQIQEDVKEFRSGQEKQIAGFESAAYANFATPAAF
jgi:hypothetical protein